MAKGEPRKPIWTSPEIDGAKPAVDPQDPILQRFPYKQEMTEYNRLFINYLGVPFREFFGGPFAAAVLSFIEREGHLYSDGQQNRVRELLDLLQRIDPRDKSTIRYRRYWHNTNKREYTDRLNLAAHFRRKVHP